MKFLLISCLAREAGEGATEMIMEMKMMAVRGIIIYAGHVVFFSLSL